jgi:hypothetical protein
MKRTLMCMIVLLLSACGKTNPTPTPTASEASLDAQEQAVFAALLQTRYPNMPVVLMDQTATGPGGVAETASTLAYILEQMTGVAPDTAASFQMRNEAAHPLDSTMDLGLLYTLLSEGEMRQIFGENQNGWDLFYTRFPGTPGIITLSRVGFNEAMDQALVYIGIQSHWLAGAGTMLLMQKVNGVWSVLQEVMTWIS